MLSVMVLISVRFLLSIFGNSLSHFRFDADVGIFLLCSFGLYHVVVSLQSYLVYPVYVHQARGEIEYCETALSRDNS